MQPPSPQASMRVTAFPPFARVAAGALVALAGTSLPLLLVLVIVSRDPPLVLGQLWFVTFVFSITPALAAMLLKRAYQAELTLDADGLVLAGRDRRIEVPRESITALDPWRVPLPGFGCSIGLRSGRTLPVTIAVADPRALESGLARAGLGDLSAKLAAHPVSVWGSSKAKWGTHGWVYLFFKFPVFGLLPGGLLFYTHQWIAYGGPLGQYYQSGLAAWLKTLGVYWLTVVLYMAFYAGVWRGLTEGVCLAAAFLAPAHANLARSVMERLSGVAYWLGVPLFLALRYSD